VDPTRPWLALLFLATLTAVHSGGQRLPPRRVGVSHFIRSTFLRSSLRSGQEGEIDAMVMATLGIVVFASATIAQPSLPSTLRARTVASPEGASIFVRSGGPGPAVLWLHGYARNERFPGTAGRGPG
jgi:hypothetical protein